MSKQHPDHSESLDGLAGPLQRIFGYSIWGMAALVVVQTLLLLPGLPGAATLDVRHLVNLCASIAFLGVMLLARRLAGKNQNTNAVVLMFGAILVISTLIVVALPLSGLGLALVAPVFGLIVALPYVSRRTARRMGLFTIVQAIFVVVIAALLGPGDAVPTTEDVFVQALPVLLAVIAVVLLFVHLNRWMADAMNDLREARATLETKVAERTEALQQANAALKAEVEKRDVTQQKLSAQTAYLSTLNELSLDVIDCLDGESMMDAIISRACEMMDTPHGFIGLLDVAGDRVTVIAAKGVFAEMTGRAGARLPAGMSGIGASDFTSTPLIIEDYDAWPRRQPAAPPGVKSYAIYPLHLHENKRAGVLVMASTAPARFDAQKQEMLARLSNLASIGYANVLLNEDARQHEQMLELRVAERTAELSTLLGVARNLSTTLDLPALLQMIFQQIDCLIDYDAGTIFEVQGELLHTQHYTGPEFAAFQAGAKWPLSGHHLEIVRTASPIIIQDVRSDAPISVQFRRVSSEDWLGEVPAHIVSWIGVPMKVQDRVIGILTLDSAKPHHFNERHAELLTAVAQQAALALENARLYARASQTAAQAERSRLARDLHDSVSQAIYGIVLASRTLEKLAGSNDARMAAPLQHILSLSDAAMAEIRALIFELRPESLEREGILTALIKQADAARARYGLDVRVELCKTEPAVPLAVKEALYRIAQEAMHNTVKHAHARNLWLKLGCDPEATTLEVRDDGVGFDMNQSWRGQMGLTTMRERAQSAGGRLDVSSQPQQGTQVRAVIPLSPAPVAGASGASHTPAKVN